MHASGGSKQESGLLKLLHMIDNRKTMADDSDWELNPTNAYKGTPNQQLFQELTLIVNIDNKSQIPGGVHD